MRKPVQHRSLVTRDKILAAAEALVAREGIGSLTMDAVAQEGGLSKGGVLHHFRSKEMLVTGLALRKLQALDDGVAHEVASRAGEPHPTLTGMIAHASSTYGRDDDFSRAMLVAAVENSLSLETFRALFARTLESVRRESAQPDTATALLFAIIGVQVSRSLGYAQVSAVEAQAIFDALRQLTAALPAGDRDNAGPPPGPAAATDLSR